MAEKIRIEYEHECEICGKEFKSIRFTGVKYCSRKCKRKAGYDRGNAGRMKAGFAICPHCRKEFKQGSANQVYCSNECRYMARKIKDAEIRRIKRERQQAEEAEKRKRKERLKGALVRKELAAREMGMTYGKYCLWLEQHPEEREVI